MASGFIPAPAEGQSLRFKAGDEVNLELHVIPAQKACNRCRVPGLDALGAPGEVPVIAQCTSACAGAKFARFRFPNDVVATPRTDTTPGEASGDIYTPLLGADRLTYLTACGWQLQIAPKVE